jgi:predicted DNA-binding transcriptional regulator
MNTDLAKQKEWLKYLHQNHLSLHTQHSDHKESSKTETARINSWISYLHKSVQKQEKQLTEMQKSIERSLKEYETTLADLYEAVDVVNKKASEKIIQKEIVHKEPDYNAITQAVLQNLTFDVQSMKANMKQELYSSLQESLKESLQEHYEKNTEVMQEMQQQLPQPVQQPIHSVIQTDTSFPLANPEQKLLNLLISESEPLTYAKVSQLTGHSINTVRVNMNSLKKKGFVEESTLPSGVKLFSVTNKEKIKKIYNVQVL